jgi:XTP/dITP diphosphohydrolase
VSGQGVLLIATRSTGKLRELRPMFARAGIAIIDLVEAGVVECTDEDAIEAFDTFEANAFAKADYFFRLTSIPTVADDSGLEVFALGGRPGVRSKRWSGRSDLAGQALDDANNDALQRALASYADRRARYVCAAVYVDATSRIVRTGDTHGEIVREPLGAGGFGYDPYFRSSELGVTFGEASPGAKERVSHRGRAFRALIDALPTSLRASSGGS